MYLTEFRVYRIVFLQNVVCGHSTVNRTADSRSVPKLLQDAISGAVLYSIGTTTGVYLHIGISRTVLRVSADAK